MSGTKTLILHKEGIKANPAQKKTKSKNLDVLKGRPTGSFRNIFFDSYVVSRGDEIAIKIVELALKGDVVLLKFLGERIFPGKPKEIVEIKHAFDSVYKDLEAKAVAQLQLVKG